MATKVAVREGGEEIAGSLIKVNNLKLILGTNKVREKKKSSYKILQM